MKPYSRADRVGGQIQKILAEILRKDIKDPRLKAATITGVKMTRDLKLARIYFISSGKEHSRQAVAGGFKSASGYLKRTLAGELGLRYMPDLVFFYDESFDYGAHIDSILKSIETGDATDHTTTSEE